MAYGDLYNTALSQWDALGQDGQLRSLGFTPNYKEAGAGFGYDIPQQYYGNFNTGGDGSNDAALAAGIAKSTQFDQQKWLNDQGIVKYFDDAPGTGVTPEQQQAWRDNWARSFNQFGFNFGGMDDYLRNQTGPGHVEQDATLGKLWVPDNKNSQTWNNGAMAASGAPQGGALAQGVGNFMNSGGLVKTLGAAVLGAGATDVFNGGANSWSNIFNQATGGGSGAGGGGGAGGGMSDTNFNWFDEVGGTNPDGTPFSATNVPSATGQLGDLARSMQAAGLSPEQITQMLGGVGTLSNGSGSSGGLPSGSTSALAKLLGISDSTGSLINGVGTTLAGLYGANKSADTIQNIFNQQRTDRAPALAAYNNALSNPDTFYQSAPAMGAADAAARALSVKGNPAWNPGSSSQLAANNLGGYNSYLNNLAGPAFGGQQTQAALGTALANTSNQQAGAVSGGLGALTTPTGDLSTLLKQLQGLGGTGGMSINFGGPS